LSPRSLLAAAVLLAAPGCSSLVATAIARAPNHGRIIQPGEETDPGELARRGVTAELRVAVGPPDASLSVWVVDPCLEDGVRGAPRGTILLVHGWRRSKPGLLRFARPLARAGYRAVLVDLRGQGESTGDWLTYGVQESRDLSRVLDELEVRGIVSGPVGILGYSYGAAVAIQLAAADERVEAVVALAPFTSLSEVASRCARLFLPFASRATIEAAISEAGRRAGFDPAAASPLAAIGGAHARILLVHGKCDGLVPPEHSERLHAAAPSRSELYLLDGVGHNAICRDPGGRVSRESVRWLETWLGRPAAVP
jgi:pimeloyl-ACP methyl ester carboxylesterase